MRRLPWPLVFQVLGVLAAGAFVVSTWEIWLLVFTAVIVAAAILPAARAAERRRVPRGATVLAVYLAFGGVLALMGRLVWPALAEQGRQFSEQVPQIIDDVRRWLGSVDLYIGQWGASLPAPKAGDVQGALGAIVGNTLRVATGGFGFVVDLLAMLVIASYLVIDARELGETLVGLLPPRHRPLARALGEPVMDRIGGYVRGQIASSFALGVLIAVGLSALDVRYPLLIAALAFALNFVPFLGGTIAAILAILSALSDSLGHALAAAAVMGTAQLIEGKFLAPYFVGRATGLHPVVVLVALLAGFHLAGLIGGLVVVPLVAGLWEIVRTLYVERRE
jgi:predicted PurR-regulated permease PerM